MAGQLEASFDLAEGKISIDAWQERFGGTALLQLAGGLGAKYAPGGTPTFDRAASYITVRVPVLERISQVLNKEISFSPRPTSASAGAIPQEKSLALYDSEFAAAQARGTGEAYLYTLRNYAPFEYFKAGARAADYITPTDKAVFYSGKENDILARTFARETSRMTIEDTPGGKWLVEQNLFGANSPLTRQEANTIWEIASQRYAQQASGEVNIFARGADPNRTFYKIEYPTLKDNLDVYKYIYRGYDD